LVQINIEVEVERPRSSRKAFKVTDEIEICRAGARSL
jgi:hypothetical protein